MGDGQSSRNNGVMVFWTSSGMGEGMMCSAPHSSSPALSFSRIHPSARYHELITRYTQWHQTQKHWVNTGGCPFQKKLQQDVPPDAQWTLLDYGCGRAWYILDRSWDVPGIVSVTGYDPAVPEFAHLPEETFDVVTVVDILEHLPPEDVDWVLDEIFAFARHRLYIRVGTFPARKTFPNGENINTSIFPATWWQSQFDRRIAQTGVHFYGRIRETPPTR